MTIQEKANRVELSSSGIGDSAGESRESASSGSRGSSGSFEAAIDADQKEESRTKQRNS